MLFRWVLFCVVLIGLSAAHGDSNMSYTPNAGWHKIHLRAATWNEARKICIEEGGHLAILNSRAEAQALRDLFTKAGPVQGATDPTRAFIGIHNFFDLDDWVTVLGDSLGSTGYIEWNQGQPDNGNGGGTQHCAAFMTNGLLDDIFCNAPCAFICELPL